MLIARAPHGARDRSPQLESARMSLRPSSLTRGFARRAGRPRETPAAIAVALGAATAIALSTPTNAADVPDDYASNLELIRGATTRNANHDGSPWRDTRQSDLSLPNHLGPRSDYLPREVSGPPYWPGKEQPGGGGNPERAYPNEGGGQFRIACEFSHFAYDDPIVAPGKPGGSHLHMFWGNTDANAYSTYDTLVNSGSSTCNGQEINRTAYWMPALFDGKGNVRIPMRAIVYYKGYGLANGRSQVYPPGAAIIAKENLHAVPPEEGGVQGFEQAYQCADQFRGGRRPQSNTMPNCPGGGFGGSGFFKTIELHVKFPNCWNGQDPSDPDNWTTSLAGSWYFSQCQDWVTTPNIEYIVQYQVDAGENTADWYLASDVNRETLEIDKPRGSSLHADWWGGWREDVNRTWLDECANFEIPGVPTGCGFGYLSDNGPDGNDPKPGPALKFRPQYDAPQNGAPKVAAATLYEQLCPGGQRMESPEEAAWCTRGDTPVTEPEPPVSELPPGKGLRGEYHEGRFFGSKVGERLDGPLNIDLNRRLPAGSGLDDPDDVSVRWRGFLVPDTSETLTLWTRSDDGVRVYIDGEKVIDNWTDHAPTIDRARVTLEAGRAHAIAVQYYQGRGGSMLKLGWQRDGDRRRLIPRRYLYADYPL